MTQNHNKGIILSKSSNMQPEAQRTRAKAFLECLGHGKTIYELEDEDYLMEEEQIKGKLKRCSVCNKPLYSYNQSGLCCRHLMDKYDRARYARRKK
jgi:uncharacterized protein with PIN domain